MRELISARTAVRRSRSASKGAEHTHGGYQPGNNQPREVLDEREFDEDQMFERKFEFDEEEEFEREFNDLD
jgi:hypothetical protein